MAPNVLIPDSLFPNRITALRSTLDADIVVRIHVGERFTVGIRLMAGLLTLDQPMEVRILHPQLR